MKKGLILIFVSFLATFSLGQSIPTGIWKTIDDNSGEARSHIEIYEQGGQYFGKIVKLLDEDPNVLCEKCPGDKKNKPVVGLVIIENMKSYKDYWRKGDILDPESGNEYGCSIWFEEGNKDILKVRGKHWTGLYRTQTWYRIK